VKFETEVSTPNFSLATRHTSSIRQEVWRIGGWR